MLQHVDFLLTRKGVEEGISEAFSCHLCCPRHRTRYISVEPVSALHIDCCGEHVTLTFHTEKLPVAQSDLQLHVLF